MSKVASSASGASLNGAGFGCAIVSVISIFAALVLQAVEAARATPEEGKAEAPLPSAAITYSKLFFLAAGTALSITGATATWVTYNSISASLMALDSGVSGMPSTQIMPSSNLIPFFKNANQLLAGASLLLVAFGLSAYTFFSALFASLKMSHYFTASRISWFAFACTFIGTIIGGAGKNSLKSLLDVFVPSGLGINFSYGPGFGLSIAAIIVKSLVLVAFFFTDSKAPEGTRHSAAYFFKVLLLAAAAALSVSGALSPWYTWSNSGIDIKAGLFGVTSSVPRLETTVTPPVVVVDTTTTTVASTQPYTPATQLLAAASLLLIGFAASSWDFVIAVLDFWGKSSLIKSMDGVQLGAALTSLLGVIVAAAGDKGFKGLKDNYEKALVIKVEDGPGFVCAIVSSILTALLLVWTLRDRSNNVWKTVLHAGAASMAIVGALGGWGITYTSGAVVSAGLFTTTTTTATSTYSQTTTLNSEMNTQFLTGGSLLLISFIFSFILFAVRVSPPSPSTPVPLFFDLLTRTHTHTHTHTFLPARRTPLQAPTASSTTSPMPSKPSCFWPQCLPSWGLFWGALASLGTLRSRPPSSP